LYVQLHTSAATALMNFLKSF